MKNLKKRIFSSIIALCMVMTMFPISAFATNSIIETSMTDNHLSHLYGNYMQAFNENNNISIWDGSVSDSYAGGSGTASDPYLIENGAQLAKIAIDAQNAMANKHYKLISDIYLNDISDSEWFNSLQLNQWTPIGSENDPDGDYCVWNDYQFSGNFNGQGHTIYGIYINDNNKNCCGLFGCIINANIYDLKVSDSYISGNSNIGAIAGHQSWESQITNCESNALILGNNSVAGIVGHDLRGIYKYCINRGNIDGIDAVGGIIGMIPETCSISVSLSYNTGEVSGRSNVGGIVGDIANTPYYDNVENCYNTGKVYGLQTRIGGIVGNLSPNRIINNCYNIGTVESDNPDAQIGGIFGEAGYFSEANNCYYLDTSISGGASSSRAKTDEEMRQKSTFENYDFESVWFIDSKSKYPYPQLIFPDSRLYAKVIVVDKNTNQNIFDYEIDINQDSGLFVIPSEDETSNLSYIVGEAGNFLSHTPIYISKDGYEKFLCYSDDLQNNYSLSNAYENVIYLTPSTGGAPDIDTEQQEYILEHVNFVNNSYSDFVDSKGFQNAYWQFDNGDSLHLANIGNWMSNVSEIFSGKFNDIKISATYYDLFLADLMISLADMEKSNLLDVSVFDTYKKYNLATVDSWIKKFKDINSQKNDLFNEVERDAWDSLMSDIDYMTKENGKVGWDALAFDLENLFNGKEEDYEIDDTTKKIIKFISSPQFIDKNQNIINEVFEGMSVANEVSGYISSTADTVAAFQQCTQAYVATITCNDMYSQLFEILDDAISKMDSKYSDKLIKSLKKYKDIANNKNAMYLECAKDLIEGAIIFTYDNFIKDYVTKAIYTDLAKLIGCPASAIKAIVMAYNIGFGIGDTITGLSEKSEQYTFMYYISPLEKALEETVAEYAAELSSNNSYEAAKKFDSSFNILAATNKYLYHCMYTLGASGLPITVGDKHFGQLPIFMELSSKLTSDWNKIKCHGNYTFIPNEYKYVSIQCPVDLYVYDLNNDVVVSIIEENIVKNDASIEVYVSNGRKSLILPIDKTYSLKIVPRDEGIMNYYVAEISQSTRNVEFYNIPLKINNYYTGNIPAGLNNGVELYSLSSVTGNRINADYDSLNTNMYLSTPQALNWHENKAKWNEVQGASKYLVSLYKDGDLNKLIYTDVSEYDFYTEILQPGNYTFDVIAISDNSSINNSKRSYMSNIYEVKSYDETIPVNGISLNKQFIEFNQSNMTYQLQADVQPVNATNKSVTWFSSNHNIVTVDNTGLVTALTNGTAIITAKTVDGSYTANCTVIVDINNGGSSSSSSSGGGSITPTLYNISVQDLTGGIITVSDKNASKGKTVTITVISDEGYKLKNLTVSDKNGNSVELTQKSDTEYTFVMPNSNVTITATFVEINVDQEKITMPFYDISENAWYYNAVKYVYENDMMQGLSDTEFAPTLPMNRAMIVTVLHRLENTPVTTGTNQFADVESNQWYTEAVQWAFENGIVSGYSNTKFAPIDSVTREQLAVILYNYSNHKGCNIKVVGDLKKFKDADCISDWAKNAISWSVGVGLISGKNDNILDPIGTATRAEVAQILMNYCKIFER